MKLPKIISAFTFLLLLLFVVNCTDDFVDVDPEGPNVPVDALGGDDISSLVTGAFNNLYEWSQHSFGWMGVASITSDEADKGSSPGDTGTDKHEMDAFTYTSTSVSPRGVWEANYRGINRVHTALEAIEAYDGTEIDEEQLNQWTAEMRFLRGYYYFILVRTFGDIPKVTRTLNPAERSDFEIANTRVPKEEIYDLIEEDLDFASKNLKPKGVLDVGHPTTGAARALLAKVHMYQNEWQEVYDLTAGIINSGEYSLHPRYEEIWREVGENNSGSVWEVQCYILAGGWPLSIAGYTATQGVRGQFGWGFNSPSEALVEAYEPGDPRMDATIIFAGEVMWDGVQINEDPPNPRYSEKMYVSRVAETWDGRNFRTNKNMRILRYADVLLMHAEAANELGRTSEALTSLNAVRGRARGDNPEILPDVTTTDQTELREAIWHERHVEFAMEYDRFFDVVRQGRGPEIFGPLGFQAGKHEVFPIPQEEIDLSDGLLTQNPGY